MLDENQKKMLDALIATCNQQQLIWVSGYLQGCVHNNLEVIDKPNSAPIHKPDINIYYATETGNSKMLSLEVMKHLRHKGFKGKSINLNRTTPEDLKKEQYAIFLMSTHGEGDPPESAANFFRSLKESSDNFLTELQYAILGLGDRSYSLFCGAATTLDNQLKRLGAKNFYDISLFDVDYMKHVTGWIEGVMASLDKKRDVNVSGKELSSANRSLKGGFASTTFSEPKILTGKGYNRLEPVTGYITDIVNLNDIDSNKQTYHIEFTYDDEIVYTPGDAIGIVLPRDEKGNEITPRLYSIASAPSFHKNQLHLTVALATYVKDKNEMGYGMTSFYLANRKLNDKINFYVHQNHLFNLPRDDQDIIMIGPGTGIAPFRSFIYERLELGHTGRNWLFFGHQHAHCDFLYQAEWQEHLATGVLNVIDLAFSRDRDSKIYVQHRLQEKSKEVFSWLEEGAALYVCGAKDPMSRDVEQQLIDIVANQKSFSQEHSKEYLATLEEQNRYVKDVY